LLEREARAAGSQAPSRPSALWLDHDTPVGQVAWLEPVDPGLLAVAVVEREDLLDPDTPLLSPRNEKGKP
jgi:hypothetical protein